MRRIVELAAASLPWAIRDRYREEWLHDLEHAEDAGVRPGDVAWGAVRTAITADRMQAPSPAHAILQARVRIDAAGMHGSVFAMLVVIAFSIAPAGVGAASLVLAAAALVHSAVLIAQLHLAAATIGGASRLAGPLWLLGLVPLATAAALALAGDGTWFAWAMGCAVCMVASGVVVEATKPPKPALVESVRQRARKRLLGASAALGALTVVLCLLEALVLLPLRWAPGAGLGEAWRAIIAAGGPATPLAAAGIVLALIVVPLTLGGLGAARWARSERGILTWAAGGAFVAVMLAHGYGVFLAFDLLAGSNPTAARGVVLPLLAGLLLHFTYRGGPDLAPLPPASVPLPPGPWQTAPSVAERADEARG